MSVATTTTPKPKRFAVTFKNRLMYQWCQNAEEAMKRARTALLAEHAAKKTEPDAELATQETFNKSAGWDHSPRY